MTKFFDKFILSYFKKPKESQEELAENYVRRKLEYLLSKEGSTPRKSKPQAAPRKKRDRLGNLRKIY